MNILLSPPVTLLIFLLLGAGLSKAMSGFAAKSPDTERKLESYACGQRQTEHSFLPDYSEFFPYAFFFTIMHVLVLVVATAPPDALALPLMYVAAGVMALSIIIRG